MLSVAELSRALGETYIHSGDVGSTAFLDGDMGAIRAELLDTYRVEVSADLIEDYAAKYEVIVAARESDIEELIASYSDVPYLDLSIDGLQPEKGHETLYVVRELVKKRVRFAEPLLSSAAGEVHRLIERARDISERIGKPVRCWISDKQEAFVTGVAVLFPGVSHRCCQNHFMRDVAKQTLEIDTLLKPETDTCENREAHLDTEDQKSPPCPGWAGQ